MVYDHTIEVYVLKVWINKRRCEMFWRIIIIVNVENSPVCCIFATILPPKELTNNTGTLIIYILSKFTVSEKQDYTKLRR